MVKLARPVIRFYHLSKPFPLRHKNRLKSKIISLFEGEQRFLRSLDYIFCPDEYLLDINNRFLSHDDYTDIITFDLSEPNTGVMGEIYISTDRVRENAQLYSSSFELELFRVIFHGALHLCGFNDKTETEKTVMKAMEDQCLRELTEA